MNILQIIIAFFGSLGFSIVFKAKKKYWLLISVDGALSWMIYLLCRDVMGGFFAMIITASFCSLYAHIGAIIVKAPTTCLLMPATVPMIPGGSLYYTVFHALGGNVAEAKSYMITTGKDIFAMAIGFAAISLAFTMYQKHRMNQRKNEFIRQIKSI